MPAAPLPPSASPERPERLHTGQQRLLWLDDGAELRCLQGVLRLRPAWVAQDEPFLPGDRELHASRAWRSDRGRWLQLAALQPATYRVEPGPAAASPPPTAVSRAPKEKHPEPRGAGWPVEPVAGGLRRLAALFRRARRAA